MDSPAVWSRSLRPEADGPLWIEHRGQPLALPRTASSWLIFQSQGLPSPVISHIVDDREGHLWLGSRQGILRLSKLELNQLANGSRRALRCISYGPAEGLVSPGISGGFQPGACRTEDGRLWFPTPKGLAVLNPSDFRINPHAPPVAIEEFIVDGRPVAMEAPHDETSPALRIGRAAAF